MGLPCLHDAEGGVPVLLEDCGNVRLGLLWKRLPERFDVLLQLSQRRGADDGRGHKPAGVAPGQCQLRGGESILCSNGRIFSNGLLDLGGGRSRQSAKRLSVGVMKESKGWWC